MTYSEIVMWLWFVALFGTLVAFTLAWRGIARTDLAVARANVGLADHDDIATARSELEDATRATAGQRVRLHTRVAEG